MESALMFTDTHEWILDNGDGSVTIGISNQAQQLLGDVVFVDMPEIGDNTQAGEVFSLVESVKAASDLYAPVSGEIIEINEELEDSPELINESPYSAGWIVKIKLADSNELNNLMSSEDYHAANAE
ncbi:MAG: glycine cleavage system H protein [Psychromonas sp.]|jgi:glycine cleavage system H protein